jgi:hypothetical protein
MGGPRTNLQVVAILERAHAIRQVNTHMASLRCIIFLALLSVDHCFLTASGFAFVKQAVADDEDEDTWSE